MRWPRQSTISPPAAAPPPSRAQALDHPVLQRAKRAFDASLRLRAVGTDDVDVQRQQRATELRHPVAADSLLAVHPEDAVLVAIQRHWLAAIWNRYCRHFSSIGTRCFIAGSNGPPWNEKDLRRN